MDANKNVTRIGRKGKAVDTAFQDPLSSLFEESLTWLQANYRSFCFFMERDIVWTLQTHMIEEAERRRLPVWIYDNHKLAGGKQVDLAIIKKDDSTLTAVEIKYEPDHHRATLDISAGKLFPSRVFWNSKKYGGVEPDIDRVRKFIAERVANHGFFILIDEGSHFTKMPLPEGATWMDWGPSPYSKARISLLRVRFPS